jgi:hemerythrin superfamily protein
MSHEFIEHLKEDHEKQRQLAKRFMEAHDPSQLESLRKEIYEEIYPHVEGEEASIFEYMQNSEGEPHMEALKAIQEHHVAKVVLKEIMELNPDSELINAKAYVLDELNRMHMDEEEKIHFPMLEKMADQSMMDQLFEQYEEAEEKAKG